MISQILIDGWEKRWVKSDWKKDENLAGEWNFTSGKWNGDADDKGILLNLTVSVDFLGCVGNIWNGVLMTLFTDFDSCYRYPNQ